MEKMDMIEEVIASENYDEIKEKKLTADEIKEVEELKKKHDKNFKTEDDLL